jgi:hypothetical protein
MNKYTVLITSQLGRKGDVVELPVSSQTQERIKRGIVALFVEPHKPEETKVSKSRERKSKR